MSVQTDQSISKKRGCNFTAREKQTLLNIVNKHLQILENKSTKSEYIHKKRETWQEVALRYNLEATSGLRTWKQLRHAYENIKQKVKKKYAAMNAGSPNIFQNQQYYLTQLKTEVSEDEIDNTSFDGSITDKVDIEPKCSREIDVLEMEPSCSKQIGDTSCDGSIDEDEPVQIQVEPSLFSQINVVEMEQSCSPEIGDTESFTHKNRREKKGCKTKEQYFRMKLENARIQQRCFLQREEKEKLKVYLLKLKIKRFVSRK